MKTRDIVLMTFLIGFSLTAAGLSLKQIPVGPCATVTGTARTFSIVAGLDGYNRSLSLQSAWPVMTVGRCDTVTINIVNQDSQTHGLSVEFYANNGVEVTGGRTLSLTFLATTAGEFRVFCNTQCTVHSSMQKGQLLVK